MYNADTTPKAPDSVAARDLSDTKPMIRLY